MRQRSTGEHSGSQEVTYDNFTHSSPDGKPSDKNSRARFTRLRPGEHVMIRPDRYFDMDNKRYHSDEERRAGDAAMKAWFEYIAFKSQGDKRWLGTLWGMRSMLKSGNSLMVVCADPADFDQAYIPANPPVLAPDFWRGWLMDRSRPYEDAEARKRVAAGLKEIFRAPGHP
ncbi:MAG: hypothetical protein L0Y60_04235 [Beijerinckiaceae bacterium]|nr:hypothetical protein [Beijerinckiaceae bacterium]